MRAARDFLLGLLGIAAFIAIGMAIFACFGCATMARQLGIETQADTEEKVKAIHAALDLFGHYGSIIATTIGAGLVAANHAYRNRTRAKALRATTAVVEAVTDAKIASVLPDA